MQALNTLIFQLNATLHSAHRCTLQSVVKWLRKDSIQWLKQDLSLIMKEIVFRGFFLCRLGFSRTALRRSSDAAFLEDSTQLWLWFFFHLYILPSSKLLPTYLIFYFISLKIKWNQTGKAQCSLAQLVNHLFHILPSASFACSLWVTAPFNHTSLQCVCVAHSIPLDTTLRPFDQTVQVSQQGIQRNWNRKETSHKIL